ncbi:hypothetical protein SIN8267_01033 [Sinobacterium norvegicum]|uniref:Succinylglutamate desuccinylase/Aspartoacylase catalytic domain-containing protein n=1 Tax=Sinobacterium norvegicum TaxID=1641715 RepID=A0ABN8EF37_9GAMM|nr:succinylglutamate desuccinylase/aspartoacylase family protein [Sinobacterium norvegicum]CAH0990932.1 hypothetical protein SIN8267_01033 [Sinobacterium norvegicum]
MFLSFLSGKAKLTPLFIMALLTLSVRANEMPAAEKSSSDTEPSSIIVENASGTIAIEIPQAEPQSNDDTAGSAGMSTVANEITTELATETTYPASTVQALRDQVIEQLPQAESVDLGKPMAVESPAPASITDSKKAPQSPATETEQAAEVTVVESVAQVSEEDGRAFVLLGKEVPPATSTRLMWQPSQGFAGLYSPTPVLVVNGKHKGPTLCLTAAVHGDELNGIEMVRQIMYTLDIEKLNGTVVGVPIVNLQGFHRGTRYLTDRRDLNRYFPGNTSGSSADRIAHSFFHEVILHCDAVVDLHTGSFYRTNLPQLRADLTNPQVVELTKGFGSTVVLHGEGSKGTLRYAAVQAGIPAVTLEAGGPMMLDKDAVDHGVKAIRTLLNKLGMLKQFSLWGDPEPVYYTSVWERAEQGGILFSNVKLGSRVNKGQVLGVVTDPITNVSTQIRSQHRGRILGLALNQVVQPGFAAYHVGIQAPKEDVSEPSPVIDHKALTNSQEAAEPARPFSVEPQGGETPLDASAEALLPGDGDSLPSNDAGIADPVEH